MDRVSQRNRKDTINEIILKLFRQLKCHDTAVTMCYDGNMTSQGSLLYQLMPDRYGMLLWVAPAWILGWTSHDYCSSTWDYGFNHPRRVIQDIFPSLTPDNDIVHQFKTSSAAGG